ncbi:hypothetical protein [Amycolatopsis sp. lyj-23]|uniref:hypothetical protein n=1 Tax=Amycolatopsis sp. lyj-23 TaxID=2789283 RepID=UPI00397D91D2
MKHVRTTAPAPAASEPSSAAPAPSTGAATPAGAVTEPGTGLKLGQRAVVPFKFGTAKSGTIAITVTAIEKGDNADLAKYGDKAKGITPYYLRAKVENIDGADLAYASLSLHALGPGGRSTGVIITGSTDRCESGSAGKDFTTAGATFETCTLQGAREGNSVEAATYDKGDGYYKSPVVWTR